MRATNLYRDIGTGTDHVKSAPIPYLDDADRVLDDLERFITRTTARAEMRADEDRALSADDCKRVTAVVTRLADLGVQLEDVLPEPDAKTTDMQQEFLKYQRHAARASGLLP